MTLIMTLEPRTVPINVFSHSTYDIASSNEDKSLQRQFQGSAAIRCKGAHCITLHSIWSLFSISTNLMFFPSVSIFLPIRSRTMTKQQCRQSGIQGTVVMQDQSCRHKRALGLITPLLGGSARSCLNRPQSAGD